MKKMGIEPEGAFESTKFVNTVYKCHYKRVSRAVFGYSHDLSCHDVNTISKINGKSVPVLKTREIYRAGENGEMIRIPKLCIK